jgi:hypothetical protein
MLANSTRIYRAGDIVGIGVLHAVYKDVGFDLCLCAPASSQRTHMVCCKLACRFRHAAAAVLLG